MNQGNFNQYGKEVYAEYPLVLFYKFSFYKRVGGNRVEAMLQLPHTGFFLLQKQNIKIKRCILDHHSYYLTFFFLITAQVLQMTGNIVKIEI